MVFPLNHHFPFIVMMTWWWVSQMIISVFQCFPNTAKTRGPVRGIFFPSTLQIHPKIVYILIYSLYTRIHEIYLIWYSHIYILYYIIWYYTRLKMSMIWTLDDPSFAWQVMALASQAIAPFGASALACGLRRSGSSRIGCRSVPPSQLCNRGVATRNRMWDPAGCWRAPTPIKTAESKTWKQPCCHPSTPHHLSKSITI